MLHKKLIILYVLIISLHGSETKEHKQELLDYSHIYVNDSLSFYAAKVNIQNFQDDQAYSVGLLLQKDDGTNTDYGIGYMQPCEQIDSLLGAPAPGYEDRKDDGILFFMNYHF